MRRDQERCAECLARVPRGREQGPGNGSRGTLVDRQRRNGWPVLAACLMIGALGCGKDLSSRGEGDGLPPRTAQDGYFVTSRLEHARKLLDAGDPVAAEAYLAGEAEKAEREFGSNSLARLDALTDLASYYFGASQPEKATATLETACALVGPEGDAEFEKMRLTSEMNLGDAYHYQGKLEKAEACLRRNVQGRERFYGKDHPGYVYGLEPLSSVLLELGKAEEAASLAHESVRNLRQNEHPRLFELVALYLEAVYAHDPAFSGLPELTPFDPQNVGNVFNAGLGRCNVGFAEPEVVERLFSAIVSRMQSEAGFGVEEKAKGIWYCAHLAAQAGAAERQCDHLGQLMQMLDGAQRPKAALAVLLVLAKSHDEAGLSDQAEQSYLDAKRRATALGDGQLRSEALRNLAIQQKEMGKKEEAEAHFKQAIAVAEQAGEMEMLARARVAYGIFVQHEGRLEEARQLLEAGLPGMESESFNSICARSHLEAIKKDKSCGCGDTGGVYLATLRSYLLEHLPEELVEDVSFDSDGSPELKAKRQLTPEEVQRLDGAVAYLRDHFHGLVKNSGFAINLDEVLKEKQ